jgi:hypothetical protein
VRKIWNGKKKCISVLVLAATVFAMAFTSAYGASGIDTTAQGTITFGVGTTELTELTAEGTKIQVSLYKVADVKVSSDYSVVEPFDTDSNLKKEIESVSGGTTADDWSKYAAEAEKVVDDMSEDVRNAAKTTGVTITGGEPAKATVGVGLYLVLVDPVDTNEYEYTAAPFLIAVPGNDYGTLDATTNETITNDSWRYEVESNIKFGYKDLLGNLSIDKTLSRYNDSLGTATFVYEVKAVKDYRAVGGEEEKTVYNNVVAIDFSNAGIGKYTITDIPAGAEVTVTEVYSGASYSVEGNIYEDALIKAGEIAKVEFTNDYDDDSLLYQDTVVNNFSKNDETWDWFAIKNGKIVKTSQQPAE